MTSPRSSIISLESTPWYHCVCRCVRRAFLCGKDKQSDMDFEHRWGWIAERIMELSAIFSIDVAAYAVLSNHYHIVMRVDEDRALAWTDHEVFTRWVQLFKGPDVVRRYLAEDGDLSHSDQHQLAELAGLYRSRLYDISWFMRMLNESIARKANREEGVSGRFWEGRFKSQALLDEKAILAAMAYVDLNPVRAGMAKTPEESEYTSIKERLDALTKQFKTHSTKPSCFQSPLQEPRLYLCRVGYELISKSSSLNESESITLTSILASRASATAQRGRVNESANDARLREPQPPGIESLSHLGRTSDTPTEKPRATLAPFDDLTDMPFAIPFGFHEYVELVDWTGRQLRRKKMSIREKTPPILSRLGVDAAVFVSSMDTLLEKFGTAVGDPEVLRMHCKLRGLRCMPGVRCDVFFDAA